MDWGTRLRVHDRDGEGSDSVTLLANFPVHEHQGPYPSSPRGIDPLVHHTDISAHFPVLPCPGFVEQGDWRGRLSHQPVKILFRLHPGPLPDGYYDFNPPYDSGTKDAPVFSI